MQVPEDLERRLIGMVAEAKKVATSTVQPEMTFETLGMDSLDKINLSFAVEEAFGIEIPDAAIGSIRTVREMVDGVRELVAAKAA